MKINLKLVIGILAISLVAFAACKKKKDDSPKARLSGKWKFTQMGSDDNNNGVMEADEVVAVPDSFATFMTFSSDGNGNISTDLFVATLSAPFTWSLINNDKDISVKAASGSSAAFMVNEGTIHIISLTSSDLVASDTSSVSGTLMTNWSVLKKQ